MKCSSGNHTPWLISKEHLARESYSILVMETEDPDPTTDWNGKVDFPGAVGGTYRSCLGGGDRYAMDSFGERLLFEGIVG